MVVWEWKSSALYTTQARTHISPLFSTSIAEEWMDAPRKRRHFLSLSPFFFSSAPENTILMGVYIIEKERRVSLISSQSTTYFFLFFLREEEALDALWLLPGGSSIECAQCVCVLPIWLVSGTREPSFLIGWWNGTNLWRALFFLFWVVSLLVWEGVPSVFVSCACHESESCVITKNKKK